MIGDAWAMTGLLGRVARGEIGASTRKARLADLSPVQAHRLLISAAFHHRREPCFAARARAPLGAARWLRIDRTSASDATDPAIAPVDRYVHEDGGMVSIFPLGHPWGRVVPAGRPAALKSVLFVLPSWSVDPVSGARAFDVDTTFRNEAFRVTDDGRPLPKSRRAVYGLKYDPHDRFASCRFAREVYARHVVIPLRATAGENG